MDITQTFPYYKGEKILFIHGFASSGATHTVDLLKQKMPETEILHPDLPIAPSEMLPFLQELCKKEQPSLIIGTSMGAGLAEKLHGYDRICVNPALHMDRSFGTHIKYIETPFTTPRQDGVKSFNATKAMAKEFGKLSELNFNNINAEEEQHVTGLFGLHDEFLSNYDEFSSHYPLSAYYDGGHHLNDKVVLTTLMPIIRRYWNRHEHIEPQVIYIDIDTLRRSDNLQQPSARIAIQELQMDYDLYFVLPQLHTTPKVYADALTWLKENIGIAAFNRTLCCDHPNLLLGDYYITQRNDLENLFIDAVLIYGSAQFKTWDSLIEYFFHLK